MVDLRSLCAGFAVSSMAGAAPAQDLPPLFCTGTDPGWSLELVDGAATLGFRYISEMRLELSTSAEGRDWPVALTLIGRDDTAIALIERTACGPDRPYTARILTQRRQTPILLVGCCEAAE